MNNQNQPVITRMPPSPTGHLHIGTVRTALFNYLFAKQHQGRMILRIEDTDQERSTKAFETEIIEGLSWLGLSWDNEHIYRQTERTEIYRQYLEAGIAAGTFYESEEPSKKNEGEMVTVVRLKNPNKTITFNDLIRGDITFDTTELGDFVIARAIDDPLYHLTVVVDDHEMQISHVLRGEDHISNTSRQILIQEAIGAHRPAYAHLPLILAPDKSKLSKRHGAVALAEYQAEGFLPEAIINYLALLGWNPGTDQEIFTLPELVEQFSLDHIQKGGAVFDRQKFLWINKAHLDKKSDTEYFTILKDALPAQITDLANYSDERLQRLLPTVRERAHTAGEITMSAEAGEYDFVFTHPTYDTTKLQWKNDASVADALPRLKKVLELLETVDFSSPDTIKAVLWPYAEEVGKGEVLWPMRLALTGLERSPDPFTVAYIIGKSDTLQRLETACDKISA